jgi:hypothetical protein
MQRAGDGIRSQAGRQETLQGQGLRGEVRHRRAGAFAEVKNQRIDQLKTDDKEEKNDAEKFAGAALGQPSFDPDINHAAEKNIQDSESQQGQCRHKKQRRRSDRDSEHDAERPQNADRGGGLERTEGEADQKVGAESQRETQQVGRIDIFGKGAGQHREKLPEQKYGPK